MPKKQCKENWDKIPFTSEHIFKTDGTPHKNPTYCEKCGKSYQEYDEELLEKSKKFYGTKEGFLKDKPTQNQNETSSKKE